MSMSYKIGYYTGRVVTRIVVVSTGAKGIVKSYNVAKKVAKVHKIATGDPQAVTDNVFDCLPFVE